MGIFSLFFNKKTNQDFLKWQKLVIPDSPDRIICSRTQLQQITNQQAENDLKIINDCRNLLSTTYKADVFFSRLDLLKKHAYHLLQLQPYIRISGSISNAVDEISRDEQDAIFLFLVRYYIVTLSKCSSLKTEKGRQNQYKKFQDSLIPYYSLMNPMNIAYIETCTSYDEFSNGSVIFNDTSDKLEKGELPWGWYHTNQTYLEKLDRDLMQKANEINHSSSASEIATTQSFVTYYESLRMDCYKKGQCFAYYFDTLEYKVLYKRTHL